MAALNQYNLNRQVKKNFTIGDIVQKEDGTLLRDHISNIKYLQGKIKNMMSGIMELSPIDEHGNVVKGTIHIMKSEVAGLKIVTPMNTRNYRRASEERAARNARAAQEKLNSEKALLSLFKQGQQVVYRKLERYSYGIGGGQSTMPPVQIDASIVNVVASSPPYAQISYTKDGKKILENVHLTNLTLKPASGGARKTRRSKRSKRKTRSRNTRTY
jgi:hypothetical protein